MASIIETGPRAEHDKNAWAAQESDRLSQISADMLKRAQAAGADSAEVAASIHVGISTTVRMGQVETLEYSRDRGLGITVYFGQRKGNASSGDLSPASLEESLQSACAIARFAEPDECNGLAEAGQMAQIERDLDLWHPWDLDPRQAIELATGCEAAALAHDAKITNSEGGTVATGNSVSVYANSHGFVGRRKSSRHSVSAMVVAADGDAMQRDYWYDTRRNAGELQDAEQIGVEAARRALRRCGARSLPTTEAPVLFVPETARSLVGHLISAISGSNLYRGSSFLLDQVGQKLFPEFVEIGELPFLSKGLRSTWYDGDGVATSPRQVVEAGVLKGYVLSTYSARKLGLTSTGNAGGVHNLTLSPGSQSQSELISSMSRGLIVTELMGQGVNITTGDYSRGAAGFWVENGQIAYPVEGITIAGRLKDLFARWVAVGSDLDDRSALRCPSIVVDKMTIAGQ